jgi:hypothetical protein
VTAALAHNLPRWTGVLSLPGQTIRAAVPPGADYLASPADSTLKRSERPLDPATSSAQVGGLSPPATNPRHSPTTHTKSPTRVGATSSRWRDLPRIYLRS